MLALDLSSIVPFAITAIAVVFAFFFLVKKAAVKYFVVDETFDHNYDCCHLMSIGSNDFCAVCRKSGSKICSRCKNVRYCSQACQSKHWHAVHKSKCKPANTSNKIIGDPVQGKKSAGFGSISLVPARGSYKKLVEPKKILFSYDEFLKLFNWNNPEFPPCGLLNCGNSCFANVVLQCLSFTRPLTAYLLEKDHSRICTRKQEDWCFLCELQIHIQRVSQSSQPFSPTNILSRIPNIGGNLGYGSQEDAHEFMRFAIDTMQSICLDEHGGEKYLDPSTQETTLIQHIFGGHLQSQVKCTKCNAVSNRYENMMDLTVEIHGANDRSLEQCLNQFTASECLDGDNKYKCDGCNDYVKAWKRLTVHQAPNILTITLKRFQSGRFGKLNKRVTFPEELDLSPYMSEDGDGTDLYSLYAVVVHVDMLNASYFGHYICYIKHCGRWYMTDDGNVKVVDVDEVLSEGAYMLLYSRRTACKKPFSMPKESSKKKIEEKTTVSNDSNTDTTTVCTEVEASSSAADITNNQTLQESNDMNNQELIRDTGHDRVTGECGEEANIDSNAKSVEVGTCTESSSQMAEKSDTVSADEVISALGSNDQEKDMECEEEEAHDEMVSSIYDSNPNEDGSMINGGCEMKSEVAVISEENASSSARKRSADFSPEKSNGHAVVNGYKEDPEPINSDANNSCRTNGHALILNGNGLDSK